MAFPSSSERRPRATRPLVATALALLTGVEGAVVLPHRAAPAATSPLAAPADGHQVANLLHVQSLVGSVSQVRGLQRAAVLMEAVPQWATPMPHCVRAVNGTLTRLSAAYLAPNVPTALHQSCEDFQVYSDIGGDKVACRKLMAELSQEFKGERNYYTWCRSLTLSSFDVVQKMHEMFEANETLKGWRNECSTHCPYVAKMMEASASINMFLQKFMMEAMQSEDQDKAAKDMQEMLEMLLRQFNQMCDWRYKATCNSQNMHSSCTKLLEPSGLDVDGLGQIEKECDAREGCRKACQGVDANLVDYTLDQLELMQKLPLPSTKVGREQCQAIDALAMCAKKESCETYLTKKVSMSASSATEHLETWKPTCDWFEDSCAEKRETVCKTQVAALRKVWKDDIMCLVGEELSEECCKTIEEVAACDASNGCGDHLVAGIPLLGLGLETVIPEQCPQFAKLYNHTVVKVGAIENTSQAF